MTHNLHLTIIVAMSLQGCGDIAKTDNPTGAPSSADESTGQTTGAKNNNDDSSNNGSVMQKTDTARSTVYHISGSCTYTRSDKIKDHCTEFGLLNYPTKDNIDKQKQSCISANGVIAAWSDAPCVHAGTIGGCETSKFTSVSDIMTTWEYDEFFAATRKNSCVTVWNGRWLDP